MTTYLFDPDRSNVWIEGSSSVHPITATAHGITGEIEVDFDGPKLVKASDLIGQVRIEVERLRSGNILVDRETRRRIDARNHPEIVGTVRSSTRTSANSMDLSGEIEFRGQTVAVSGEVTVQVDGNGVCVSGSETFDVRQWGLTLPRLGLLRVHPKVSVRIELRGDATA